MEAYEILIVGMLRSSPADPMKQVSLAADGLFPRAIRHRRFWIMESCRDAYEILFRAAAPFDPRDVNQVQPVSYDHFWMTLPRLRPLLVIAPGKLEGVKMR